MHYISFCTCRRCDVVVLVHDPMTLCSLHYCSLVDTIHHLRVQDCSRNAMFYQSISNCKLPPLDSRPINSHVHDQRPCWRRSSVLQLGAVFGRSLRSRWIIVYNRNNTTSVCAFFTRRFEFRLDPPTRSSYFRRPAMHDRSRQKTMENECFLILTAMLACIVAWLPVPWA